MARHCNVCIGQMGEGEELYTCPLCGSRVCGKCLPRDKRSTGPCAYCEDEDEEGRGSTKKKNSKARGE